MLLLLTSSIVSCKKELVLEEEVDKSSKICKIPNAFWRFHQNNSYKIFTMIYELSD